MIPDRARVTVSSSGSLIEGHLCRLGYQSFDDFLQKQNPDGLLDSLVVPGVPTVRLIRHGSDARNQVDALGQLVFGHVTGGGFDYAIVQVS